MSFPPSASIPLGVPQSTRGASAATRAALLLTGILPLLTGLKPLTGAAIRPLLAISVSVVAVATWVCYLVWLARTRHNAALAAPGEVPGAGTTLGGYFIPLVCFFGPVITLRRIAAAGGTARPVPFALLVCWMTAWDAEILCTLFLPPSHLLAPATLHWTAGGVRLVAAALCIAVVGRVDAARRAAGPAAPDGGAAVSQSLGTVS